MFLHPNEIMWREQRHRNLVQFIHASDEPYFPKNRDSKNAAAANVPDTIIIKPLILRTKTPIGFVMAVIGNDSRVSSARLQANIGNFRYANIDEILEVTEGLDPREVPPVGPSIFPTLRRLLVDQTIPRLSFVEFKAAHLDHGVIMSGTSYKRLVADATFVDIAEATCRHVS